MIKPAEILLRASLPRRPFPGFSLFVALVLMVISPRIVLVASNANSILYKYLLVVRIVVLGIRIVSGVFKRFFRKAGAALAVPPLEVSEEEVYLWWGRDCQGPDPSREW